MADASESRAPPAWVKLGTRDLLDLRRSAGGRPQPPHAPRRRPAPAGPARERGGRAVETLEGTPRDDRGTAVQTVFVTVS